MPLRKNQYRNMEKFQITRKAQRNRYYEKTAKYNPSPWTSEQDKAVLEHNITDTELSNLIGHSVKAIQIRRSRLKKKLEQNN